VDHLTIEGGASDFENYFEKYPASILVPKRHICTRPLPKKAKLKASYRQKKYHTFPEKKNSSPCKDLNKFVPVTNHSTASPSQNSNGPPLSFVDSATRVTLQNPKWRHGTICSDF